MTHNSLVLYPMSVQRGLVVEDDIWAYLHPITLVIRHNPDLEREYQRCFLAERSWWDRVGASMRLLTSLKVCGDLWGKTQRFRDTPWAKMAAWKRHVAGLAFTFIPVQMYACLYLILFNATAKTRNRLTAVLNINSVLAEGSLLLTGLTGWPCEQMPQLLQYTVLNLLVFPLFHTQRIPFAQLHIIAAVVVTSLVMAGPHGMCVHVATHSALAPCARILSFTKRCCNMLQTLLAFTSNAQLTGFMPATPCKPVCLLLILCCASISTFVLYHTECHSRILFLLSRRVAPQTLLAHHRQLLVRDLTLAAPLVVYVFWMLCYFTGGRVHRGGGVVAAGEL